MGYEGHYNDGSVLSLRRQLPWTGPIIVRPQVLRSVTHKREEDDDYEEEEEEESELPSAPPAPPAPPPPPQRQNEQRSLMGAQMDPQGSGGYPSMNGYAQGVAQRTSGRMGPEDSGGYPS